MFIRGLEDDLETGIAVLALIQMGELDISCNDCNEAKQRDLYCSGYSDSPLFITDIGEFYSCPCKWLTPQVYEWYDEFSYYEIYPSSAPSYNNMNIRYWEAVKIYKNTINSIERSRMNNKQSNADKERLTSSSLSKLKNQFRKKKQ